MTPLGFFWAKLTGNEAALERLSAPTEALRTELAGKRVALVGNARSLAKGRLGPEIDGADLVIRMNAAPMPSADSHGTRTDWLAISTPPDPALIAARAPARLLWMTRKRKRLHWWITQTPGFYLNRRAGAQALADRLGAPPTTGLMLIDLLAQSPAAEVRLYGFDFFASLSLSGRRTAADVPHDFAAERAHVQALIAADPRFRLMAAA